MTKLFEIFFPKYLWRIKTTEKRIFLTFDDGPIPEVTDWVLDQLRQYNAKATFFVVGENVTKNPGIFRRIMADGHAVGNHTYNHLKGWKTHSGAYLANFIKCENEIQGSYAESKLLFRPPYGQLKRRQATEILKTHEIVMWSVLTRDYEEPLDKEKCLKRAIQKTGNGSIVLFHDSIKAQKNLRFVLPRFLVYFSINDFEFCSIKL